MATITKSIGTGGGRDYSTFQAFEDALPANLVTDGNSYVGEAYNDSEFTAGATFSDHVTDATHTITVTAAAGQSFQDHASVRTNPLKYDQTKGVGISCTTTYTVGFQPSVNDGSVVIDYLTISRLQWKQTAINSAFFANGISSTHNRVKDCVVEVPSGGATGLQGILLLLGGNTYAVNVLVIFTGAGAGCGFTLFDGSHCIACACVRLTDNSAAGTAFESENGSASSLVDCASFGFTTPAGTQGTGSWVSSSNNATDQASGLPGTSNQHSVSFSSSTPFVGASAATKDLRSIVGTSLVANGVLDSTNAPNDISGASRAAAPTIGVWELASVYVPIPFAPRVFAGRKRRAGHSVSSPGSYF